ncbi:MAG: hypothetical protein FIA95_11825 [Gemmatimonadetes bacterium]|nr:hypothetical protein [Gemmatimonadota bacterium]
MSDVPGVRGIVVAHGTMAQGLVDAVHRIAGTAADALAPLSNEELSPGELGEALDRLAGDAPTILFADLLSGSCGMAAMVSARASGNRSVVCGVNLPILLDFVFHRDMPLQDLASRLVEKGRDGIRSLPPPR